MFVMICFRRKGEDRRLSWLLAEWVVEMENEYYRVGGVVTKGCCVGSLE